jgi:hypothetical protein
LPRPAVVDDNIGTVAGRQGIAGIQRKGVNPAEIEPRLPGPSSPPFWERTWFVEGCTSVVPLVGAIGTATVQFTSATGNLVLAWGSVFATPFIVLGWILRLQKAKRTNADGTLLPLDLSACVETLHASVLHEGASNCNDQSMLRVTIYRSHRGGDELQQCVPYAGGDEDGEGRTFKSNSGIIGKAFQARKPMHAKREQEDFDLFVEEMIEQYHIPREDAKTLRPDRKSWLAIPIFGEQAPVGVVFLDSKDKEFFTEKVIETAVAATEGIASYVRKIYRSTGEKK